VGGVISLSLSGFECVAGRAAFEPYLSQSQPRSSCRFFGINHPIKTLVMSVDRTLIRTGLSVDQTFNPGDAMIKVAAPGFSSAVGSQRSSVFTDRTEAAVWVDRVYAAAAMQRVPSESSNIFGDNFWQEIREALSQAIPYIRDQIFTIVKTLLSKKFNSLKKEIIDKVVSDTLGIVIPSFIRLKGVQATVDHIHRDYIAQSIARSREISIPEPASRSFPMIYADLRTASGESSLYAAYLEELGIQRDLAVLCLANVIDSDFIFGTMEAASLQTTIREQINHLLSPDMKAELETVAGLGRAGYLAGVLKEFEPRSA